MTVPSRRDLLAATAAALAAAVYSARSSGQAPAQEPATHTVDIDGFRFVPQRLAVRPGDTVVWRNRDIVAHTATAADGSWDTGEIPPGGEAHRQIGTADHAEYLCLFHPMMMARLDIAAAEAS